MIFIITHKDDFTVDFVIEKLNQRNINYYRFNCEDIDKKGYSFKFGNTNEFSINNISNIDSYGLEEQNYLKLIRLLIQKTYSS